MLQALIKWHGKVHDYIAKWMNKTLNLSKILLSSLYTFHAQLQKTLGSSSQIFYTFSHTLTNWSQTKHECVQCLPTRCKDISLEEHMALSPLNLRLGFLTLLELCSWPSFVAKGILLRCTRFVCDSKIGWKLSQCIASLLYDRTASIKPWITLVVYLMFSLQCNMETFTAYILGQSQLLFLMG